VAEVTAALSVSCMGTTPVLVPGMALERAVVAATGPLDLVAAAGADEDEEDDVVEDETGTATGRQ